MTGRTQPALTQAPEWMTAEMPPGYQTRLLETQAAVGRSRRDGSHRARPLGHGRAAEGCGGRGVRALKCEVDVTSAPPGQSR